MDVLTAVMMLIITFLTAFPAALFATWVGLKRALPRYFADLPNMLADEQNQFLFKSFMRQAYKHGGRQAAGKMAGLINAQVEAKIMGMISTEIASIRADLNEAALASQTDIQARIKKSSQQITGSVNNALSELVPELIKGLEKSDLPDHLGAVVKGAIGGHMKKMKADLSGGDSDSPMGKIGQGLQNLMAFKDQFAGAGSPNGPQNDTGLGGLFG